MSVVETVDFYRATLESLGYTVRGNRVILIADDGEQDIEIDGKQLVLPDDQFLRAPKWATEIPFHPLCENPQRGESEVVKEVLGSVVANLNVSLLGIMAHLYSNVARIEDSKRLSTEQVALLSYVPKATDKIQKAIVTMVKMITENDAAPRMLDCNLRRRCPLAGVKYERVCVVRFPFAEMDRKDNEYGLKSANEFDTVRGLLDFIIPGWEVDDTYSVGTNSFVAPYFISVMTMYCKMGVRLNEIIEMYKEFDPKLSAYTLPGAHRVLEMIERIGFMEKLRDAIPPLDGNKGSVDLSRQAPVDYKIDQPKPAVDLPWNEPTQSAQTAVQHTVADSGEGVTYVPGQVVPPVQQQPVQVGLQPLNVGVNGQPYDPNSFHGRQMAKKALLQPLSAQLVNHGAVGGSPFLDDGKDTGTYRPGQLQQAQREAAQRQQQQQHQHTSMIQPSGLGF